MTWFITKPIFAEDSESPHDRIEAVPLPPLLGPMGYGPVLHLVGVFRGEGLDPAFLIDREHQSAFGWLQVHGADLSGPVPKARVIAAVQPASDPSKVDIHSV